MIDKRDAVFHNGVVGIGLNRKGAFLLREAIIEKTDRFMREELAKAARFGECNTRMAEYRIEHSWRVAHIGQQIAQAEGFDQERTTVACLLHDIGYSVEYTSAEDHRSHGRCGARIARPFLSELGYSAEEVNEMCFGIAIHVDDVADFAGERTPLAVTVGDADNIDRFDVFRLYESLSVAAYLQLSLAEQGQYLERRLLRLEQLKTMRFGTPTADSMWQDKLDYQIGFFKRLHQQVRQSAC